MTLTYWLLGIQVLYLKIIKKIKSLDIDGNCFLFEHTRKMILIVHCLNLKFNEPTGRLDLILKHARLSLMYIFVSWDIGPRFP